MKNCIKALQCQGGCYSLFERGWLAGQLRSGDTWPAAGVKRLLTSFLAHFWCWWERNLPASCKLRPVSTWYKWKIVKNVWCSVEGFFLKLYSDFCVAFWKIFSDYHLHTHTHTGVHVYVCARARVCWHACAGQRTAFMSLFLSFRLLPPSLIAVVPCTPG